MALLLGIRDFEDAVQIACALLTGLDAIVTRDIGHFTGKGIATLTPRQALQQIGQTE
ncbi:MAG: PIN domain-containing protein [Chloroflexota bacterium]|nr:PIN domain-containing protein [Chloroflexota bacterium]